MPSAGQLSNDRRRVGRIPGGQRQRQAAVGGAKPRGDGHAVKEYGHPIACVFAAGDKDAHRAWRGQPLVGYCAQQRAVGKEVEAAPARQHRQRPGVGAAGEHIGGSPRAQRVDTRRILVQHAPLPLRVDGEPVEAGQPRPLGAEDQPKLGIGGRAGHARLRLHVQVGHQQIVGGHSQQRLGGRSDAQPQALLGQHERLARRSHPGDIALIEVAAQRHRREPRCERQLVGAGGRARRALVAQHTGGVRPVGGQNQRLQPGIAHQRIQVVVLGDEFTVGADDLDHRVKVALDRLRDQRDNLARSPLKRPRGGRLSIAQHTAHRLEGEQRLRLLSLSRRAQSARQGQQQRQSHRSPPAGTPVPPACLPSSHLHGHLLSSPGAASCAHQWSPPGPGAVR